MIKHLLRAITVGGIVVLTGCAGLQKANDNIAHVKKTATDLRQAALANATTGAGVRTKRSRFTGEEVIIRSGGWPASYEQADWYNTKGSMTLVQVIDDLAQSRAIPMRSAEVLQILQSSSAQPGAQMGQPGGASPGMSGGQGQSLVSIEYSGTRRGLLEAVASKGDMSVRFNADAGVVEFFRFETRTLQLALPSSKKTVSANISLAGASSGSSSSGGSSSTGGTVSVTQDFTVDPWASVVKGVSSIIDPQASSSSAQGAQGAQGGQGDGAILSAGSANGSVVANKDLNMLTITARPQQLERAVRYVNSINAKYAQNVMVDFTLYNVTLDEQAALGMNINLLRSTLSRIGGGVSGPAALSSGSSPGVLSLSIQDPTSPWTGSSLVADALQQYGDVAVVRQTQIMAVNGQPSPVKVGNDITYKSGQVLNVIANAGVTKTIQQSTITVGLTGYVLPQILEDNRILLTYALDLSDLGGPLTPDADGLVSPNLGRQSMQQSAFVHDGEALVLFGSDQQRDSLNSALHTAGGSKAGASTRQLSVIVMQVHTGAKNASN